jgi:hypothetical protein
VLLVQTTSQRGFVRSRRILGDDAFATLTQAGLARAAEFSWRRTAGTDVSRVRDVLRL